MPDNNVDFSFKSIQLYNMPDVKTSNNLPGYYTMESLFM